MPLSLVVIAFLVFFNAINHPFVHDDVVFIVQNPQIGRLDHLADVFFQTSHFPQSGGINSYYRPVLEIFYRLEYRLFGLKAAGFHLVNILIHIANGLLLFGLLCRLQFSRGLAYGISLLFLIHPVQSEAVACVAGVSNLLTALFVLLTLYCYVRQKYVLALLSLVLSLLTKEQAVMAPLLLVLIDWYQHRKHRGSLWLIFGVLTLSFWWMHATVTGAHMLQDILQWPGELKLRLLAIPRTLLMYLRLVVLPYDLHYYRNTDILQPNGLGFILWGLLLAGLGWLTKKFQLNGRSIIFGLGWLVACLLPVLNIVPLINEYSFILTAEHFLYLSMVGAVIVMAAVLQRLIPKKTFLPLAVIIFLGLGALTVYQNTFWRGEIPLFERVVTFEPNFARGHVLLAKAYLYNSPPLVGGVRGGEISANTPLPNPPHKGEGMINLAIEHYSRALTIMKEYERKATNDKARQFYRGFIKDIYVQMAVCYIQKGDQIQAQQLLKMAIGLNPLYSSPR
ncbi:MAG: hypothetical protein HY209_06010 [Candidatus Omnitrophica bacterium]|nr:hypothetical protein [Candidatus Omnitrophota bacterium]